MKWSKFEAGHARLARQESRSGRWRWGSDDHPDYHWFNVGQGGLVYNVVTGDFIVTAEVSVENFVTPGIPTTSNYLGLILARDPIAPPQYNVWIGAGAVSNQWSVEPKSTVNSVTEYVRTDWSQCAILRIIGTSFRMLAAEPASGVWSRDVEYIRPDLPSALQVGIAASCSSSPLDLETRFEAIAFATRAGPDDCIGP